MASSARGVVRVAPRSRAPRGAPPRAGRSRAPRLAPPRFPRGVAARRARAVSDAGRISAAAEDDDDDYPDDASAEAPVAAVDDSYDAYDSYDSYDSYDAYDPYDPLAPDNTSSSSASAYPPVLLTRGQLAGKDVVTRTSGARLGVITRLWVDPDAWEVTALDVRPRGSNPLEALVSTTIGGAVDHVLLSSLRQVGDVALVHDESAVERRWSSYGLSTVVGCDVVTERGVYVGRVRDFEFDPEDGLVQRLIVDALGLPAVPEGVVSAYAVDVSEILSAGADRVVVRDGAEARVEQLSQSLLQRLELTAPPWEEDLATYADYYAQDAYEEQARADAEYYAYQTARLERERMRTRDAPRDPRRTRREGIPLVRASRPFERRDADGGYGEPPPRAQAYEDEGEAYRRRPQFDEWVEPEERVPEYEYEYEVEARGETAIETGGAATGGAFARRAAFASPPPPPPEAWGRVEPPTDTRAARDAWGAAGGAGGGSGGGGAGEARGRGGFDANEDLL